MTAPFMHDGRFATLEEVVEHYNSGVQDHTNLNSALIDNGMPQQLNMTAQQKIDVINFLKTLTDSVLVNHIKFSDPFISSFTFLGTVDDKFDVGANWDVGISPPSGYDGIIIIKANCVIPEWISFCNWSWRRLLNRE